MSDTELYPMSFLLRRTELDVKRAAQKINLAPAGPHIYSVMQFAIVQELENSVILPPIRYRAAILQSCRNTRIMPSK